MLDYQDIAQKLERLSTEREKLESYRQLSRAEFKASTIIHDAACYSFIVAIQVCMDLGAHIIAALGLRKPGDSGDIFAVLAEEGIVQQNFVARLQDMVRFRNILAHRYWFVDLDKVYHSLHHDLDDLDHFRNYIIAFIEEQQRAEEEGV